MVEVEIKVCDVCGNEEHVYDTCLKCGNDYCYDCAKVSGVDYRHSVYSSGSGDGYFCNKCIVEIRNNPQDKYYNLHEAYLNVARLRKEVEADYKDTQDKQDEAEKRVKYSRERAGLA